MTWTPPPDTAALIFDCDGTLADTMPVHFRAWQKVLADVGIPFGEVRFYQLGGVPTEKIVRIISDETGVPLTEEQVQHLTHGKEAEFVRMLDHVTPIAPVKAIAERHRGKLPMAVASGGYREVILKTVRFVGMEGWFDATVTAEDTTRHKPEPDVFLEAARRLNVDASRCVVFEDTDIGLEAARRAGAVGVDVRAWIPPRAGER
ncbi:MAG: HAD-IA family hydrolase [Fimbriiglobus sp.]|jgi:beta-phosphoglucomutase family hydrolase|nr:HAD-IA family hydrolase [Fimbriiglobus sp.]